jgi:hypothetical protein
MISHKNTLFISFRRQMENIGGNEKLLLGSTHILTPPCVETALMCGGGLSSVTINILFEEIK